MNSYIRDFIEETGASSRPSFADPRRAAPSTGSTGSVTVASDAVDRIKNAVQNPTPAQRSRAAEIDAEFASGMYDPMDPNFVWGNAFGSPLTLQWAVDQGLIDEIPTRKDWEDGWVLPRLQGRLSEEFEDIPDARTGFVGWSPEGWADDWDVSAPGGGGRGGGGRGGGGALGPVYVNPDRAQIEDYVKAYVVATTGRAHADLISQGVEAFLKADRQGFDSEDQSYDPQTAMKNVIRGADKYKAVQDVRPDSVDEMQWVSSRQGKLRQLGLSASLAEDVGISQAMAGATDEAVQAAGQVAHTGATGRLLSAHRERLKNKALAAARLVQ
jgi:hypothetical protein